MRLIGRYASPFVRRVAVSLQLYGLAYAHRSVMPFGAEKASLRKLNPIARVPILELADGDVLIDSAVILDHLDRIAAPELVLTPPDGAARRRVQRLVAVALGANEKLVAALYERHFRPRELWHRPWIEACEKQVQDGFEWLEDAFEGPYFAGGRLSQADVSAAVFWRFGAAKRPGLFARLNCPRIAALTERLETTAAFQATLPEPENLSSELAD